jgi:hypothetical protein
MTVSCIPLFSSPTNAKRKSLNSELTSEYSGRRTIYAFLQADRIWGQAWTRHRSSHIAMQTNLPCASRMVVQSHEIISIIAENTSISK